MPIIEANAVGRPILTSNIEPLTEVGGNSAYYVDPYDINAIRNGFISLMADKTLRIDLIERGLKNAKRFNAKTIAEQYSDLYKRLSS